MVQSVEDSDKLIIHQIGEFRVGLRGRIRTKR